MIGPGRIVAGVVSLGLMAGAMWLYHVQPRLKDRLQKPIAAHGRAGAVVGNSVFSVKVGKVDVATAIAKPVGIVDKTKIIMPSLGLFVIVQMQIRSNEKPFQPGHVRLGTRGGVTYDESGRTDIFTAHNDFQPMLWGPATFIFEIPKDRLAGSHVLVGQPGLLDNLSGETDVDLGIDGSRAAQLLAHASSAYPLPTT
jgi:hypothetical protein